MCSSQFMFSEGSELRWPGDTGWLVLHGDSHDDDIAICFVSKINFPTLYRWDSSSAETYFQPSTLPQNAQLMSQTVWSPVTYWRGTGRCITVLGSDSACEVDPLIETALAVGSAETRYARPWRPVNPLLMIWALRHNSAPHLEHRRHDTCPVRYLLFPLPWVSALIVEGRWLALWLLGWKIIDGNRNLGNRGVGAWCFVENYSLCGIK